MTFLYSNSYHRLLLCFIFLIQFIQGIQTVTYIGCYKDKRHQRILNGLSRTFVSNSMTVQLCTNYCAEHGFPYAGLQFRSECYCGVAYTHSNFQKQSSCCTWLCSGSRNETCGGELCNSVYQTDLAVTSKNSQYVSLPSALLSGSTFSPSPCKSNPCHADGICSSTAVNNGTYMCKCKQGRIGLNCEHLDPCRLSNTCQNGQCLSYFNGSFGCLCQNNSCLNGGICDAGRLTTLTCNCPSQFYGERCELKCGCRHGGRCIINQNRTICRCDESRFYGDMCEFISPCASQPCYFGGTCLRNGTNFSCKCPPNKIGSQCEGNDPCQQNPCAFNSTCYRVNDISYKCVCDQVHTGTNCNEIVPMISRYGVFHSACVKNQDCNTTLDLICFKEKRCACAEGYTWTIDKQKPQTVGRCEPINVCLQSSPCQNNGQCIAKNGTSDYMCLCSNNYSGKHCQTRKSRDRSSQCYDGFCLNGGSCFVTDTSELECSCPPGYTGKYCDITIGPCYSNPCPYVDSVCLSVQDGYICLCNDNHLLEPYCNVSKYCPGTICNGRGICYNTIEQNSYCRCLEPYSGAHCTLIDTCGSNPCDPSATCIPMELGSYCACPPNRTGPSCAEYFSSDLCQFKPCLNSGVCSLVPANDHQQQQQYKCQCTEAYQGTNCEQTLECPQDRCRNNSTCTVTSQGHFECLCLGGFTGTACERAINVPLCTSETCLNGGTCTQSPVGGFVCNCLVNYTGNRCEDEAKIEIRDPCATNPCLNAGTCIPNQVGGFTCNCLNGFTGNRCDDIAVLLRQRSGFSLINLAWIVPIAFLLFVIIIILILFLCCKKSSRRKEEPVYVYDPNSRTRTPITTNTLGSKTSRRTYREYANPGFVTTTDLLKE